MGKTSVSQHTGHAHSAFVASHIASSRQSLPGPEFCVPHAQPKFLYPDRGRCDLAVNFFVEDMYARYAGYFVAVALALACIRVYTDAPPVSTYDFVSLVVCVWTLIIQADWMYCKWSFLKLPEMTDTLLLILALHMIGWSVMNIATFCFACYVMRRLVDLGESVTLLRASRPETPQ
jgi:hypothetical protein